MGSTSRSPRSIRASVAHPAVAPARKRTPALRGRRRKVVIGSLSALAVLGTIGLGTGMLLGKDEATSAPDYGPHTVTIPGDLDGDNKVTDAEKKEALQARDVAVDLQDKLLAPKSRRNVTTLLVTPPGERWWKFVTSFISEIKAYNTEAPEGVNWYAVTWAKKTAADASVANAYPMLHIAFADNAAAGEYAGEVASNGRMQVVLRDNVLSLAPDGVRTLTEKLPQELDGIVDVKQTTGYWSIDYAKKVAIEATNSPYPAAYRAFWENLGFADAQWTAVAREPDRWVGKITGWDRGDVELLRAIEPLAKGATERQAAPLQPVSDAVFAAVGTELAKATDNPTWVGQPVIVPSDTEIDGLDGLDLMLVLDNAFMGGWDMSGWIQQDAPFPKQVHWIFGDTMIVEMRTAPPMPSDGETPTPVPDGPGVGTGPSPDQPGKTKTPDADKKRGKRGS